MTDKRRTSSTYAQTKYTAYTTSEGGAREKAAPLAAPVAAPLAAPPPADLAAPKASPKAAARTAAPLAAPLAAPTAAQPARKRRSVVGGRIAAAGVGIAAMMGLVANMEVADGNAKAVTPAKASATSAQRAAKGVREGTTAAPGRVAAAKVRRPIVLTPHAVVNTVSAPSSGGSSGGSYSGGGSGYSAPAPAPAAAPVASSGGS
jgi:hypothetical protein